MGAIDDLLRRVQNAEEDVKHSRTLIGILLMKLGGRVELDNALLMNPGEYQVKTTEDQVTGNMVMEARHIQTIEGE